MFRAKTLLVIGAGASAEVGMPIGSQLLEDIVELTNLGYDDFGSRLVRGDYHLSEALKSVLNEGTSVESYNNHLRGAWQLAASAKQALSIDNVIDALEDERVELVGKLGIVRAIHKAEAASSNFQCLDDYPGVLDLERFNGTWYDFFTKLLTENVKKSEIDSIFNNLEIINFNYDRCIENYLPHSIANYYGVGIDKAQDLVGGLIMHRPYGVAGKLPWQESEPKVEFGGGHKNHTAKAAEQIKTFTEQVEESDALEKMKIAISSAERIVFLGFAFHRQNVELLKAAVKGNLEILATTHGVSSNDRTVIRDELVDAFNLDDEQAEHITLANGTCSELFRDYWRTLTADATPERVSARVMVF